MMQRRDALRILAAGAAWPVADSLIPGDLLAMLKDVHAAAQSDGPGTFRALDGHAAHTVAAACERLIPADETPGAVDAGVPHFIDHMLAGWYEPHERDRFLTGLQTLDTKSRAANGRVFVQCTDAEQEALLTAFDRDVQALEGEQRDMHWFGMLKYLTVWGYCTSEAGMKTELHLYPQPMKYDGSAPYKGRS
jgi:hypothetical protein